MHRKSLFVFAMAAIVMFATASSSAFVGATTCAKPANSPMRVVSAAIVAAKALNPSAFAGLYAPNAIVVDEGPPFTWTGATAGTTWMTGVKAAFEHIKMTHFTSIATKPIANNVSCTGAYVVVPMTLDGDFGHTHFHEAGTFTFTLRATAGTWLITSQVWTRLTPEKR